NAWNAAPFRFAYREDPAARGKVNVPCFNSQALLRPAAGVPGGNEQVAKVFVFVTGEQGIEFRLGDDLLFASASRLLHMPDGAYLDVALFFAPFHCTLDGGNEIAARAVFDRDGIVINPLLDVEGLEVFDGEVCGNRLA